MSNLYISYLTNIIPKVPNFSIQIFNLNIMIGHIFQPISCLESGQVLNWRNSTSKVKFHNVKSGAFDNFLEFIINLFYFPSHMKCSLHEMFFI